MIDSKALKTLFDYENGVLYWRTDRGSNKVKGKPAGSINREGYCKIKVFSRIYGAHKLVWLWHGRDIPIGFEIDHINGNPSDNRIENLRLATHTQNTQNARKRRDNTSGHKNISYVKKQKKWRVMFSSNKKIIIVGVFTLLDDAVKAAAEARKKLHDSFARES